MSVISLKLNHILPINCGEKGRPLFRVICLLPDSFLISKHSVSMTKKEIFGDTFNSAKKVDQGREKFFKALLSPLIDPPVSDTDIRRILEAEEDESIVMIPLREDTLEKRMFHEIESIRLKKDLFSGDGKIEMTLKDNGAMTKHVFSVCAFTPRGVKDSSGKTKEIFKTLKQQRD